MTMRDIFVFGSNLAGIHGAGAAAYAHKNYGAAWGVGEGLTGESYALPTKGRAIETIPLAYVGSAIHRFADFARGHPEMLFHLTPVGCGLAGFSRGEIWALLMAASIPANVVLTSSWVTGYNEGMK